MRHARTPACALALVLALAACGGDASPTALPSTPTLPPSVWASPTRGAAPPPIAYPTITPAPRTPTAMRGPGTGTPAVAATATATMMVPAAPPITQGSRTTTPVPTSTQLPRPALGTPQVAGLGTPATIAGVNAWIVAVSGGGTPAVRDPADRVGVPLFRLQVTITLGNDTDAPLPFRLADFALVDRLGDPTGPRPTTLPDPLPTSGTIAPHNTRTGVLTFHVMPTQQGLILVWLPHPRPDALAPGSAQLAIGDAAPYAPSP
jgi:hypothetical protein